MFQTHRMLDKGPQRKRKDTTTYANNKERIGANKEIVKNTGVSGLSESLFAMKTNPSVKNRSPYEGLQESSQIPEGITGLRFTGR